MNSIAKIVLALLASAAALTAGIYYYKTRAKEQPPHAVVARDRSDSMLTDCGCTEALAKKALSAPGMSHGSTITVIASGDGSTADEPVLVGSFDVPTTRRVIEGRGATGRKQKLLLDDLRTRCEALHVTKRSPILLLIRRGVDRLRQFGCTPTSGCILYVQTDGEETAELQIKRLLDDNRSSKLGPSSLIDNQGIDVVFYGLSQTVGETEIDVRKHNLTRGRDMARAGRIQDVWLSLFSEPGRVRFEPFCPNN
jgi:hypothetical protein